MENILSTSTTDAVALAIKAAGSAITLAGQLGVTPAAVAQWKSGERRVPAERCPDIEKVTGVRCELLRPDVAWDVLRMQAGQAGGADMKDGPASEAGALAEAGEGSAG